jgi:membrane-bound lytic murein transglycosylase F
MKNYNSEELIDALSDSIIDYTVAEYYLAKYQQKFYGNLDISVSLSDEIPLGWMVRQSSPKLLDYFNGWVEQYQKTIHFKYLYYRYFEQQLVSQKKSSDYFSTKKGKISPYDEIIKKQSKNIGWDWRLVSALIYEESHFQHDLISPAGAYGIMQFMPSTAEIYKVNEESTAEEHLIAGAKYIKSLEKHFEESVPDFHERVKFVIASYNIGPGHIFDAMALARKYHNDCSNWQIVAEYLQKKNQIEYYTDEVVKHGFMHGRKTVLFVKTVMERYEHFKNHFTE